MHEDAPVLSAPLRDLPLDGEGPVYQQIQRALAAAIRAGRALPGTRLPASRNLASDLGVARSTVLAAYDQLLAEGYAVARVGAGTFVAAPLPEYAAPSSRTRSPAHNPSAEKDAGARPKFSRFGEACLRHAPRRDYDALLRGAPARFDFRPCVPELERLPTEDWRRTLARSASSLRPEDLDYADPSGSPRLREELARYLARARGVICAADDIVVVGGLAQALDISTRLLVEGGDPVLLEEPGYQGARRCFESAGVEIAPLTVDGEGLDAEGEAPQARLAYVTPSHQFPTGSVMSLPRRLALLRWAEASDAFILEDDYDSEFRYSGRAIEALKSLDERKRVIYVGTFSKSLFPALRIAYVVLPPALRDAFRSAKWIQDWASPTLEQEALAQFIASGDFERHLRRARTLYGKSRRALLETLRRHFPDNASTRPRAEFHDSRAGLHLLVRFPELAAEDFNAIASAARKREIRIYPASTCYSAPPKELELIFGFTRLGEEEVREGIARFREVLVDFCGA